MRVLDDLSGGRRENLAQAGDIELIVGDIREFDTCHAACADCDLIFHQAALGSVPRSMKDPATTIEVNVAGTANVFAAARDAGARRVVYASSSSVYGDSPTLPKREGEEGELLSPYALSKSMNEQLAAVFAANYPLRFVGLRYFNVYGPRQLPDGPYAAVVPRFFTAAFSGAAPHIHGNGEQSRDFTFVGDAVAANILAATVPIEEAAAVVNVAGGRRVTINDLANTILALAEGSQQVAHGPPREGDVRHSLADLERVSRLLGYKPTTDLRHGLETSLAHYRQQATPPKPEGA